MSTLHLQDGVPNQTLSLLILPLNYVDRHFFLRVHSWFYYRRQRAFFFNAISNETSFFFLFAGTNSYEVKEKKNREVFPPKYRRATWYTRQEQKGKKEKTHFLREIEFPSRRPEEANQEQDIRKSARYTR